MAYNIFWMSPDVNTMWSFRGRLYQSLGKAEIERNRLVKWKATHIDRSDYWKNFEVPPIYEISLTHKVVTDA